MLVVSLWRICASIGKHKLSTNYNIHSYNIIIIHKILKLQYLWCYQEKLLSKLCNFIRSIDNMMKNVNLTMFNNLIRVRYFLQQFAMIVKFLSIVQSFFSLIFENKIQTWIMSQQPSKLEDVCLSWSETSLQVGN